MKIGKESWRIVEVYVNKNIEGILRRLEPSGWKLEKRENIRC